jgi:hypothetical protein
MSMNGYLRRLTPGELKKIANKPASIKQLLRGGYDMKAAIRDQLRGKESPRRAAMEAAYARALQIKEEIMANPERTPGPGSLEEMRELLQPLADAGAFGNEENVLPLEKSWHVLHYLLSGSAEPDNSSLGKAILGGKEIGPDLGYGPARMLTPEEVTVVAAALSAESTSALTRRVNVEQAMAANLYACREPGDLELAQAYFEKAEEFYAESATQGAGMLFYIR